MDASRDLMMEISEKLAGRQLTSVGVTFTDMLSEDDNDPSTNSLYECIGGDCTWHVVAQTWQNGRTVDNSPGSQTPDIAKLNNPATVWYDVRGFYDAATSTNTEACVGPAGQTSYTYPDRYVQHANEMALYTTHPNVLAAGCHHKCGDRTTRSNGDFCDGNSPALDNEANALCLDFEACFDLCNTIADCRSFDMHKTVPRCYLNTLSDAETAAGNFFSTSANVLSDSDWDLVRQIYIYY